MEAEGESELEACGSGGGSIGRDTADEWEAKGKDGLEAGGSAGWDVRWYKEAKWGGDGRGESGAEYIGGTADEVSACAEADWSGVTDQKTFLMQVDLLGSVYIL